MCWFQCRESRCNCELPDEANGIEVVIVRMAAASSCCRDLMYVSLLRIEAIRNMVFDLR